MTGQLHASDEIYIAALSIFWLVAIWFVVRLHCTGRIKLEDLVTTTDRNNVVRLDKGKTLEIGAFVFMSWAFVVQVLRGQLTEWFFAGYGLLWVGARGYSAWLSKRTEPKEESK